MFVLLSLPWEILNHFLSLFYSYLNAYLEHSIILCVTAIIVCLYVQPVVLKVCLIPSEAYLLLIYEHNLWNERNKHFICHNAVCHYAKWKGPEGPVVVYVPGWGHFLTFLDPIGSPFMPNSIVLTPFCKDKIGVSLSNLVPEIKLAKYFSKICHLTMFKHFVQLFFPWFLIWLTPFIYCSYLAYEKATFNHDFVKR